MNRKVLEYTLFGMILSWFGWFVWSQNQYPHFLVSSDESQNLVVFVGKKVSTEKVPGRYGINDSQFKARYQVLQVVYGRYRDSMIEFTAFDHYGFPNFGKYETVLLYVTMRRSWLLQPRYFHEKYQYQPVYSTADGRWAGCGDPYYFDEVHRGNIQAQAIHFNPEVVIDITKIPLTKVEKIYPKAFFEHRKDSVVCRKGVFLDELFAVKREGVLKARGIFK